MKCVKTIAEVRQTVAAAKAAGNVVGLVPTMGALHAGHASLIDAARKACGFVVVSIFVNPTQFAPTEDLAKYPRTPEKDLELCRLHGGELVFMPGVVEMYPIEAGTDADRQSVQAQQPRPASRSASVPFAPPMTDVTVKELSGQTGQILTEVSVKDLSARLCGKSRPTHFAGVCTVVAKLFNIVLPDAAFFGTKDYQQATIIRRMVADLNFPVQIEVCPTVREADGLAMSSRNAYLSAEHRRQRRPSTRRCRWVASLSDVRTRRQSKSLRRCASTWPSAPPRVS